MPGTVAASGQRRVFHLHRQVCVPAPAMALCPGLLTAAPRRGVRARLSATEVSGSLLAAAAPRPPFPQPLPQFLELRTRRLQFLFQPLLSLYRLTVHSPVVARLPPQLQYLPLQLRHLAPARRRAASSTLPGPSHASSLSHRSRCVQPWHTGRPNVYCGGDHRRDGLPARDRGADHRPEG